MSEPSKHNTVTVVESQTDPEVLAALKKIQQHLVYLEKKIDLLIGQSGQSAQRPSGPPAGKPFRKHFSKPFRPGGGHSFDRNSQPREGDRGSHPQGGEPRKFGHSKKPFFPRKDRH